MPALRSGQIKAALATPYAARIMLARLNKPRTLPKSPWATRQK